MSSKTVLLVTVLRFINVIDINESWAVWVTYQLAEEPHGLLLHREKAHP